MKRTRNKQPVIETVGLEKFAGGGQTLGVLPSGKKVFVWGALPGEIAHVRLTKQKAGFAEAIAEEILQAAPERIAPQDAGSYLSTSPWQILDFGTEQQAKAQLVGEAFALHHTTLPGQVDMHSDGRVSGYRNKVEFSWWWDNDASMLDLAFFQRGSHGKLPVDGTSLAAEPINVLARAIRDLLRGKNVEARSLKTLLIRCDRTGNCSWQLYVKDRLPDIIAADEAAHLPGARGGEVIYSDPRSPASRVTERLRSFGDAVLQDDILGTVFKYATEGFFQVNLPVYEQALRDMAGYIDAGRDVVDMYSGVGSIGLTIGRQSIAASDAALTLVEIDQHAFREMERNVAALPAAERHRIRPVLAPAEKALDYITGDATIIVDPPRAGLHESVVGRLLAATPPRIIYLSCNPVTQARDAALLLAGGDYRITHQRGYNFFPRTPHIEHLIVLDRQAQVQSAG